MTETTPLDLATSDSEGFKLLSKLPEWPPRAFRLAAHGIGSISPDCYVAYPQIGIACMKN